ncbi:MAG: glycosyltransferase [Lamprobacter sp.]|uniref:glycosyltransferase n=1 Tax=Lamprobacter sp. TaxID=3100796 RepID=UPI002B256DA2|nr:glycosyltransferase [Lamprobacter sp.]MEA3638959.1 glycosyltransferase [Lamprobacter sp.]
MRLLHVEGGAHLYGGALQLLYLLEGLAARGIDNHLACRRGCELATRAASFAQVHEMPMGGDLDLLMIGRLYHLIRQTRPDLVHLHSRIGADLMGGIAARLAGVPVLHTRRVDNPEPRLLVATKYRLHDRVIAISAGIERVLLAEGLPAAKLRLVRSAVPAARFARPCQTGLIRERLGLPEDALLLGVVAQLIARKGHLILLRALPALLAEHPRLQVVFFGQGPLAGLLKQQINATGLSGRVHLVGFRDDLAELLPCLTLLVHPALMEGLGVSLLQAAAAGVPIVASRVGGIPEAVEDAVTGILLPAGDSLALKQALRALLNDPGRAARLGQAGAERVRRDFSIDAMVEGNLEIYQELLAEDWR